MVAGAWAGRTVDDTLVKSVFVVVIGATGTEGAAFIALSTPGIGLPSPRPY